MRQNETVRAAVRVFLLSCSLAACVVIGSGPWATLQTFAWARMAVDYTLATGSVRQGLTQTFDGEHPCELCRQIRAGAEKERWDERQRPGKDEGPGKVKFAAVLPAAFYALFARESGRLATMGILSVGRLADAPPVPPPRVG